MNKVTHAPDKEGQTRIAAAMEKQNALLAAIAAGNASNDFIDTTYAQLLDDTNTTQVFQKWWPLSDNGVMTKEERLARWFRMLQNDKTYGVEFRSPDASGDSFGTFTQDRVGVSCELSTDAAVGADDLDEHRAFWWLRVNAVEIDDQGTLDVKFTEFEEGFDSTGEIAPVQTLQVAPWIRKTRTDTVLTRQLRTMAAPGYHKWCEGIAPDGTHRPYVSHYTYPGGYDAESGVTSGAGKRPIIRTSYNTGLTAIKKNRPYQTGWQSHDQNWLLLMWQLRHGSLEPSGQMEGCLSYNFQYLAAVAETGVKRVLLTAAQAANLHVGSSVSVGETGGNTSTDRNTGVNYNLADCVRVISKETVEVDGTSYVAVNLDIPAAIDTTTTTRISTMPWYSGTTDAVRGRNDGSPRNNTNGQNACRCAGIEFGNGAYRIVFGDFYKYTENTDGISELQVYACTEQGKEASSITSDYVDTGLRYARASAAWDYVKEMDDTYDSVFFPKKAGGTGAGSTTYLRSGFYHPAYKSGSYVPWSFGFLYYGGLGGVVYLVGDSGPGNAHWYGALGLSRRCSRGELTA